jgi:toxin CcdB
MAQWDVHANPQARSGDDIPYIVVVQSDLLDLLPTRLVMPLSRTTLAGAGMPGRLAPLFDVAGQRLRLKPQEAGTLPVRALGPAVASLRAEAHRIVDALDAVVSGI